jgi:uncharacterized protein YuzE
LSAVRIGQFEFDHVLYDADADVLYLSMGEPVEGHGEETPEGHFLRFDENGELRGVTLIDAQFLRDRDGRLMVTMPVQENVDLPTGEFQLC